MAKLTRERALRERRMEKQAKKAARKLASADDREPTRDGPLEDEDEETPDE